MSMICPICHNENRDGAKYCDECGFPLSGKLFAVAAATNDAESDEKREERGSAFRAEEEDLLLEAMRTTAPVKRGTRTSAGTPSATVTRDEPSGKSESRTSAPAEGDGAIGDEDGAAENGYGASVAGGAGVSTDVADMAAAASAEEACTAVKSNAAATESPCADVANEDALQTAPSECHADDAGEAETSNGNRDAEETVAGAADDREPAGDGRTAESEADESAPRLEQAAEPKPEDESEERSEEYASAPKAEVSDDAADAEEALVSGEGDECSETDAEAASDPADEGVAAEPAAESGRILLEDVQKPQHRQVRLPQLPTITLDAKTLEADEERFQEKGERAAEEGSLAVEGSSVLDLNIPAVINPDEDAQRALEQEIEQESDEFGKVAALAYGMSKDRAADRKISRASHIAAEETQVIEPVSDTDETVAIDALERKREAAAGSIAKEAQRAEARIDFTGFDEMVYSDVDLESTGERLVGSDYQAPKPEFRDGSTMKMPKVEGEPEPANRDYLTSSAKRKRVRGRVILGICGGLVAVAAITAGVTYHMELWGGVSVPNVEGMSQEDATAALEAAGFEVQTNTIKSDDTEGTVIVEDPTGGSREAEGTYVVIHIATPRTIPDVVGGTEDDARAALNESGYVNVTVEYEKSDADAGTVLAISPDEESQAKSTTPITMTVAEPYTVPDISGMNVTQAENAINAAGLTYATTKMYTEDYTDGSIIGTDPAAGSEVKSGSTVTIQIARSRSAELVAAAQSYLVAGRSITISGTSYEIVSLDSVQYAGNNSTTFTATARPYTSLLGEKVYIGNKSVSGTIVWSDANEPLSIS